MMRRRSLWIPSPKFHQKSASRWWTTSKLPTVSKCWRWKKNFLYCSVTKTRTNIRICRKRQQLSKQVNVLRRSESNYLRCFQPADEQDEFNNSGTVGHRRELRFNFTAGSRQLHRKVRLASAARQPERSTTESIWEYRSHLRDAREQNLAEISQMRIKSCKSRKNFSALFGHESTWRLHHLWLEQEASIGTMHSA